MLLNLRRHFSRLRNDESGNVFISVIGLLALSSVIAVTIATSTTQAIAQTTSTRAGVQAQAAADAGIAVAQIKYMQTGSCATAGGVYQNWPGQAGYTADDPQYKVTVWRQSGGTWIQGCPLDTTTKVRLVSTGVAKNAGASNLSANNRRYMEMVGTRTIQVDAGSALTFYSGTQMDSNVVISGTGSTATLQMISGDYSCTNAGTIDASLYVPNGKVTLTNHCYIKGSVYSSSTVSMDNYGHIGGDVYAIGKVSLENNAQIDGNMYTNGDFLVNGGLLKGSIEARGAGSVTGTGRVNGNVWAEYISSITGRIDGSATSARYSTDASVKTSISPGSASDLRVGGSVVLGGSIDTWTVCNGQWTEAGMACGLTTGTRSITGTLTLHQAGQSIPASRTQPAAKAWVDVPYKKTDWTDIGYSSTVLVWPSSFCQVNNQNSVTPSDPNYAFWQAFKALTVPTIVDMRNCDTMNFSSSAPASERLFKMKTDMLFLVKGFTAQDWTFDSSTSDLRRLYVISPDAVSSTPSRPHCNPGYGISWNGDKMTSRVRGFIYTPCEFYWGASATVNGQIYSGTYRQANSNETLTYYPVGIPGVDFSAGGGNGVPATFDIVGIQNRPNNGE